MRIKLMFPSQPLREPGFGSSIYHRRLGWGMGLKIGELLHVNTQSSPLDPALQKQPHLPDPEHSRFIPHGKWRECGSGLEYTRHGRARGDTAPFSCLASRMLGARDKPSRQKSGGLFSRDTKWLQRRDLQILIFRKPPIKGRFVDQLFWSGANGKLEPAEMSSWKSIFALLPILYSATICW